MMRSVTPSESSVSICRIFLRSARSSDLRAGPGPPHQHVLRPTRVFGAARTLPFRGTAPATRQIGLGRATCPYSRRLTGRPPKGQGFEAAHGDVVVRD